MDERISAGLKAATDTCVVDVGRGVIPRCGTAIRAGLANPNAVLVVADERTWQAAGERVYQSLTDSGIAVVETMIFPGHPVLYAAYENAALIRERLAELGALGVAVGSGTLNDLVKLASGELEQPYAVVGTAASMDGYSGFGAPMSKDGIKITMPCPAPRVVVFDLDVAAAAPPKMAASGYGDLMAKVPAGADWILADAVGLDPINPLAWDLVQGGLGPALSQPTALACGDPDAFEGLVAGLVLSGLAMQVYAGTRPASGAEHYFSHLWELEHLGADQDPPLSHGFKVAIGTLAMTAFYERFLRRPLRVEDIDRAVAQWRPWEAVEADIRATMSGPLAAKGVAETREKYVDADGLRHRLELIRSRWDELEPRLRAQLRPVAELTEMLKAAGAPYRPEHIGLTRADVQATFPRAMYYRSRYTVLDLARELGWFDGIVNELFTEQGLWA